MKVDRNRLMLASTLALLMSLTETAADDWRGQLRRGGEITVDPSTHRALRDYGGIQRPMWDGVHHLDDGSTVIIRDGIAVPTEQMYEAWSSGSRPEPAFEERYCDQLVRKTCGFDNACNNSAACMQARSLLAAEGRQQRDLPITAGSHPTTAAGEECHEALSDPAFPACGSLEAAGGSSRCRDLVDRVCGSAGECAATQGCDAARQLLRMETEERLVNDDPAALSRTGEQCLEAMSNPFFPPCGADPTTPDRTSEDSGTQGNPLPPTGPAPTRDHP
jgi:hypothetical protein